MVRQCSTTDVESQQQWCGSADVGSDERGSLGEGEGEYGEGEEGQEVCAPDIESS